MSHRAGGGAPARPRARDPDAGDDPSGRAACVRERRVLLLRSLRGHSAAESSRELGLSKSYVWVVQFRALQQAARLEAGERTMTVEQEGVSYAEEMRRFLALAEEDARTLNHNYIGTEQLSPGLLREAGNIRTVLADMEGPVRSQRIQGLRKSNSPLDPRFGPTWYGSAGYNRPEIAPRSPLSHLWLRLCAEIWQNRSPAHPWHRIMHPPNAASTMGAAYHISARQNPPRGLRQQGDVPLAPDGV